jgi:hypothetical protein
MNERIKELAEQAKQYAEDKQNDPLKIYTLDCFNEKFAELIVRECMRMCDCADVSLLEHNCPQEASGAAGAKEIIKEWFGVEE